MTGESYMSKVNSCYKSSRSASAPSSGAGGGYYGGGGLLGVFVAALIVGAVEGARNASAKDDAYKNCMQNNGFELVAIPDSVAFSYRSAFDDEDRISVIDEYVSSPEFQHVQDWGVAKQTNTEFGYRKFIQDHPDSSFHAVATETLDDIVALKAKVVDVKKFSLWHKPSLRLAALNQDGWIEESEEIKFVCSERVTSSFRMAVVDGWAQGYLNIDGIEDPILLLGYLDDEGRLELKTDWPVTEPLFIHARFDSGSDLVGKLVSVKNERCDQFMWFLNPDPDPQADPDEDFDLGTWLGAPVLPNEEVQARFNSLEAKSDQVQTSSISP